MSLWGATVITNLMSAIPWVGQDIVEFIWGGFSVNNATLNRFFSLHFVLPFVLAALALMHLIALHDSAGSGNPLGVSGNYDRLPFAPYFIFKDLITIFLFILVLSVFVFFMPNLLGDSENYVMANPMQTPPAIVPEWYLLPFYAILRSIPNKLLGVIAMFSAILILLAMPFTDLSRFRGIQFRPLSKAAFFLFIGNFLILMQLGAKHVESPFIEFGQISTVIYFAHFLVIVPFLSLLENSFIKLATVKEEIDEETATDEAEEIEEIEEIEQDIEEIDEETATDEAVEEFEKKIYGDYYATIIPGRGYLVHLPKNIDDKSSYYLANKIEEDNFYYVTGLTRGQKKLYLIEYPPALPGFPRLIGFTGDRPFTVQSSLLTGFPSIIKIATRLFFICAALYVLLNSYVKFEQCDAPRPWGVYFQDSASPQMEGLVELHDNILFYLVIILFAVGWILVSIARTYSNLESPVSHKNVSHGTLIELIWTITPALILMFIAFPSFKLLYLMDEVSDPSMAVLAEGHQWYWSYQYPDFLNNDDEFIEFDSYLIPESDLEDGALRMLEVDNRVIIPELTHVRFIVTGADVIHSFACPALGIKCDAYPGRLNQVSVLINRQGTFYGQCSEICGILHSSMPIVIESVSIEKFVIWLQEQ